MNTIAFRLVLCIVVLGCVIAQVDPNTTSPVSVVATPVLPDRFKERSLNLYVNQLEVIPLPEDVEQAMISDNVCRFVHKTPLFKKDTEQRIDAGAQYSSESELLNRLRSVEDQRTEALVIAGEHAFVLSNTTWMSVYTTKDLKLAARYEIPERHAEYFPFRFNNNVLFAGEESLIICTAAAKRVVRKPKRDPGIPLQISPSYFIIMSTAEITLYEFDSMTSTVTLAQSITHNVIKARFPAATDLMWTKCKVFDAALYCLDQSNGLFQFNPANFLDIKQRSTRRGCFDFVRPASQNGTFLFQCQTNGEIMLYAEPPLTKAQPLQHYIHRMQNMPVHPHYIIYVQRSKVTIVNRAYPEQVTVISYNEPLIDLSFQEEQVLIEDSQLNRRRNIYRKNVPARKSAKPDNATAITNQTQAGVFLYALFRDRIVRYALGFEMPKLECRSESPVSVRSEIRLFTTTDGEKILPLKISVTATQLAPPNKSFLMVGLMICAAILIVFIGVIYHYEHLEGRLHAIYRDIKIKEEKKKGYNTGQDPV